MDVPNGARFNEIMNTRGCLEMYTRIIKEVIVIKNFHSPINNSISGPIRFEEGYHYNRE